jgi:hypothetical protein
MSGSQGSTIAGKLAAVTSPPQPKVTGTLVQDGQDSVIIRAGDALIEVPTQHIQSRAQVGTDHELALTQDAQILVSTVVSAKSGFVGNNVFGSLIPHLLTDNCNCNCNCGGGSVSAAASSEITRPFTGGARVPTT